MSTGLHIVLAALMGTSGVIASGTPAVILFNIRQRQRASGLLLILQSTTLASWGLALNSMVDDVIWPGIALHSAVESACGPRI